MLINGLSGLDGEIGTMKDKGTSRTNFYAFYIDICTNTAKIYPWMSSTFVFCSQKRKEGRQKFKLDVLHSIAALGTKSRASRSINLNFLPEAEVHSRSMCPSGLPRIDFLTILRIRVASSSS